LGLYGLSKPTVFLSADRINRGVGILKYPCFSIITATYNSGALFDRTALSIKNQLFRDFEWIIIDGASFDDTVQRIISHNEIVTSWISESDDGISSAWNKGIGMSRGHYILILNAGDTYDPNFLQCIYDHRGSDSKVICSHARLHTEAGELIGTIRSEPHKLYRAMHLAHNWCAVPRFYYEQFGGYAEMRTAMDFEWFHRYFRSYHLDGFTVIDEPLGSYHLGGTSDINYVAGFRTNADILIRNGTPVPVANFWYLVYRVKHAWRSRRLREASR